MNKILIKVIINLIIFDEINFIENKEEEVKEVLGVEAEVPGVINELEELSLNFSTLNPFEERKGIVEDNLSDISYNADDIQIETIQIEISLKK